MTRLNTCRSSVLLVTILSAVLPFATAQAQTAAAWFESRTRLPQHQAVAGLDDEQQDRFMLGRSFFIIPWVAAPSATTARDGLGPLFNANSCAACHREIRHKRAADTNGNTNRSMVFKLSQPALHRYRNPQSITPPDPNYGLQIAINGISGVPFEAQTSVTWQYHNETLADGSQVPLRRPVPQLAQLQYGPLHPNTRVSLRMAPVLVGLGLLAQVPEKEILAYADPNDTNGDGIAGKPQWVVHPQTGQRVLGRFGYKASQNSVLTQTADAAAHDMGLTNPLYPQEQCTGIQAACKQAPRSRRSPQGQLDLPLPRLQAIAFYLEHLRVPANTQADTQPRGRRLFGQLGCIQCHRPQLRTAQGLVFEPYTDLLLHDMGPGLADQRPEFAASTQQWRTAALWGLGAKQRAGIPLLHDGRARDIREAILWHGGEAAQAQTAYKQLDQDQRQALHLFLEFL